MNSPLITKEKALSLAFDRTIPVNKVTDVLILAVQVKHLKPLLGKDFYAALVATPSNYTVLLEYVEPVLAQWVRYYVLPQIYSDISSMGIAQLTGQNRQQGTVESLGLLEQNTIDVARMHQRLLVDYLNENEQTYPLYYKGSNPLNNYQIAGGILFDHYQLTDTDES